MVHFDYLTYMESVARKLKAIGHTDTNKKFFKINGIAGLEGFLNEISDAQYPALMVVENPEGQISDNTGDNFTDTPANEFYVAKKYTYGNDGERQAAKAECKAIGQKILSKILRDSRRKENGLNFARFNRIPYMTVGPFGDQVIAVYFRIEVVQYSGLVYNADDWNE